jgi:hypothetical protein
MGDHQAHLRLTGALRAIGVLVAVALVLLGAGPARADAPVFGEPLWFGSGGDFAQATAVGDVDGDGDLDLVSGGRTGRVVVFINDGAGTYQRSFDFGAGRSAITALALADLDGDGYLDLVTGSAGQNYVYLNQRGSRDLQSATAGGPPLYGPSTALGAAREATLALAVGDVTGDGQHDIVVANDGQDYLYPGNGAGGFASPVPLGASADRSTSVVLADLDSRNGLDVVVGGSGQTTLFYNQGDGTLQPRSLTDASASGRRKWVQCPIWLCREDPGPVQGAVERFDERQVAAAYLNSDSHPDLIEATDDSRLRVFLTDERGAFQPPRELRAASDTLVTSAVAAGDVDGDGRIDIVTAHPFAQNTVYLSAGQGEFRSGIGVGSDFDKTRGAALADIDGDSDVDLVFVNDSQPGVIYRNNGAGELVLAQQFGSGQEKPSDAALADLNGDGFLDLLVAQDARPAGANAVYLHSGAGRSAGRWPG